MTDEELDALGKQMWKLQRDEKDPVFKIMFGTIAQQCRTLQDGTGGPDLREKMMQTLRDLSAALEAKRH